MQGKLDGHYGNWTKDEGLSRCFDQPSRPLRDFPRRVLHFTQEAQPWPVLSPGCGSWSVHLGRQLLEAAFLQMLVETPALHLT